MPRLPPALLRHAHALSPLLPLLLPECRTLPYALSELRWLRAHAHATGQPLHALCERRRRGEPLQYILGTQPFGDLDLLCRRGVLIPRPETEELATRLAARLAAGAPHPHPHPRPHPLRILDLCTGTGCIPLHLHARLPASRILGIDICGRAVSLAARNLRRNVASGALPARAAADVAFARGDVRDVPRVLRAVERHFGAAGVDVVVANPPYVSRRGFDAETARSVRNFEPRLALVPEEAGEGEEGGDAFYPVVGRVARGLGAGVVAVEVGGWGQAGRVQRGWEGEGEGEGEGWAGVQVWGDYAGRGRAVVAWRRGWEGVGSGV